MTNLKCYGENSFTFLLFSELCNDPERIRSHLLANLRSFNGGESFSPGLLGEIGSESGSVVWLFPDFGKGYPKGPGGFGEPDALVVFGSLVFWIEVEDRISLRNKEKPVCESKTGLDQALLQLIRFRCLQDWLYRPRKCYYGDDDACGFTFTDSREPRKAKLQREEHPVVSSNAHDFPDSIFDRLSASTSQHHFVLLARSMGDSNRHFIPEETLIERLIGLCSQLREKCDKKNPGRWSGLLEILDDLQAKACKQFWYAHWFKQSDTAGLKSKLEPLNKVEDHFVPARSAYVQRGE